MSRELEQSRPAADDATARTARRSLQCKLFGIVSKPETLGRYELVGRIGEGAWGAVHEARDPLLDRRVALKVMKNDPSDPQHREDRSHALRKEASTLAKLSHPNLVKVYDAGQADGRAYVAMELVTGGDLHRWLRAQPRRWPEIVALFGQVARGLMAAHAAGIVHRDVKPSNILMGEDGRALVGDFGLAELGLRTIDHASNLDERPREEALSTTPSAPLGTCGTPGYMAPE